MSSNLWSIIQAYCLIYTFAGKLTGLLLLCSPVVHIPNKWWSRNIVFLKYRAYSQVCKLSRLSAQEAASAFSDLFLSKQEQWCVEMETAWVTWAIITTEEVKGRGSYTCLAKVRKKYKGQLVLLADLGPRVWEGEGRKDRGHWASPRVISQVYGDCYEIEQLSFLHLDDIWMNCLLCN